jgi:hypothetical protein
MIVRRTSGSRCWRWRIKPAETGRTGLAEAAAGLAGRATEEDPASSLLSDIRVVFKTRKLDRIHSQVLMLELNKLTGRPWAERRSGAETNVRWLSNQLRPHGIRPKLLRIGKTVGKGYVRADFDRANSIGHAM